MYRFSSLVHGCRCHGDCEHRGAAQPRLDKQKHKHNPVYYINFRTRRYAARQFVDNRHDNGALGLVFFVLIKARSSRDIHLESVIHTVVEFVQY